jgi:hypothetical protein
MRVASLLTTPRAFSKMKIEAWFKGRGFIPTAPAAVTGPVFQEASLKVSATAPSGGKAF